MGKRHITTESNNTCFFLLPVVLLIHLDCFGASHRVLEVLNIEMSALTLCSD